MVIRTGLRALGFLGFFAFGAFLDTHVLEFAGLEDLATLKTFDELGVFITAYDLHARVLARLLASALRMRERL
jgi:hypothetical protein